MEQRTMLYVGGAAALVVLFLVMRKSGPTVLPGPQGPDTTAITQSRFQFASQGFSALSDFAGKALGFRRDEDVANIQAGIERERDAAVVASANAYSDAQKVAAREASRGRRGGGLDLGPFHINFHF